MRQQLSTATLLQGQFRQIGSWQIDSTSALTLLGSAPDEPGVYAFTKDGVAHYVGVASGSLSRRLYFYRKPATTQRTNVRMNAILRETLMQGHLVDVFVATPPSLQWAGWLMSGPEGLEAGIIKTYALPWNMRGGVPGGAATGRPAGATPVEPSFDPVIPVLIEKPKASFRGKYVPLYEFLLGCSQDKVSMTFSRIEELVGPLPKSATVHQAWWANHEGNPQAKGWMPARFLAEASPRHRSVVFRRFSY